MPLSKNMSVSAMVKELVDTYEKSGKIGTSTPATKREARKQALAIAYSKKKEKREDKSLVNRISDLLEFIMTSPSSIMLDQEQSNVLNTYGKNTPDFILDKIKHELASKGYSLEILKEDKDFFILTLSKEGDKLKKMKVEKSKIVKGEITAEDLINEIE
jgi:hypothetical protein